MTGIPQVEPSPTTPDGVKVRQTQRDRRLWRMRWVGPLTSARLAGLRARANLRSLLAVNLGILLASVLICGLPLYTSLMSNIELQATLAQAPATQVNMDIGAVSNFVYPIEASNVSGLVDDEVTTALGGYMTASTWRWASLANFRFQSLNGSQKAIHQIGLDTSAALPYVLDYTTSAPHMHFFSGRLPQDVPAGQPLEALATPKLGVKTGDTITLSPLSATGQFVTIRIVGVWFPKNPNEAFWGGQSFDTHDQGLLDSPPPPPPLFPLLFTSDGFFTALTQLGVATPSAGFAATTGMRLDYIYTTNTHALTVQNIHGVANHIGQLRTRLDAQTGAANLRSIVVSTNLDKLITSLLSEMALLALPLTMVVAELAGVALLFSITMASLLIDDSEGEIATLTSRGASSIQVVSAYTLQGSLFAVLAAIIGPTIAAGLTLLLARWIGAPVDSSYISLVASPGSATQAAIIAALCGIGAVVIGAFRAARLDVGAFQREQARATRRPLWQRLYLDVILAALCIAGYVDLTQFGTFQARSILGQQNPAGTADPIFALVPVLSLFAGGLLLLRLFPVGAAVGARVAKRGRGAVGVLAFAQMARATAQYTRLALLLTVCVGMGLFSLGFAGSLARNAQDRVAYTVGGDTQVTLKDVAQKTAYASDLGTTLRKLPGVRAETPIYRTQAHTSPDTGNSLVNLLGIDPATFAQVAYWRADFAAEPLPNLMTTMRAHMGSPAAGETSAPIWAIVNTTFAQDLRLKAGDRFALNPQEGGVYLVSCVVGAVVTAFPTMYDTPEGGYVVLDEHDLFAAYNNPQIGNLGIAGPTEYWLHTDGSPDASAARNRALSDPSLLLGSIADRSTLAITTSNDPITAGLGKLLLVGVAMAALLGIFASIAQSGVSARRRYAQFAVLHALGGSDRQLTGIVLWQQWAVYSFSLLAGTALGYLLTTVTLPFLQFAGAAAGSSGPVMPPYVLVFNPFTLAILYVALVVAFIVGLTLTRARTRRLGGQALRVAED